jgi:hypothetical protein
MQYHDTPQQGSERRCVECDAPFTLTAIGAKYGVTDMTARAAILRLTWAWVE